jgi:glycogen debranching enzyme
VASPSALDNPFAILSEIERPRTAVRVLKDDDSFAVFDPHGDIVAASGSQHGLYHAGTRFLSRFELALGARAPLFLSSTLSTDNAVFSADLTNPDVVEDDQVLVPRGVLHLSRSRVVSPATLTERVRVTNYGFEPLNVPLTLRFEADFADVFEVRGTKRMARGRAGVDLSSDDVVLRYHGLDGLERRTRVRSALRPDGIEPGALFFRLPVQPDASADIEVAINCELGDEASAAVYFDAAVRRRRRAADHQLRACQPVSSNLGMNRWIQRSTADLRMMISDTPYGPYPYAGIPWFSTPFGRDGIITALELLWASPDVARGVLQFLAGTQATSTNDAQDAQPGKIVHEMRTGEMAALGEVPFGRYYGSVDATPLFVVLAHAYYERTADRGLIDQLWPHILGALSWMDQHGDRDGDGFIEYARSTEAGLIQQGWKDSWDSVFHADGTLARPPIALCEVQGYAYAAWRGAAELAAARGAEHEAQHWRQRARGLQARFEDAFWCEELDTYALALDADKRPCRVRSSNPAHCLFSGIVDPSRATRVAGTLMDAPSFGGWGIRTVAHDASRYNPLSYHNGSVWPHDNAIAAAGLARYGFGAAALRIFDAMFDLSQAVDLNRLPELICGFPRDGDAPTLYPVACAPQAWATGVVYLLLQACLGIHVDARARRITFSHAMLPRDIDWLRIVNLTVGDASVDLLLMPHDQKVGLTVLRREGEIEIVARM